MNQAISNYSDVGQSVESDAMAVPETEIPIAVLGGKPYFCRQMQPEAFECRQAKGSR